MTNYYCPHCGAALPSDSPESLGLEFDCPDCHEHVSLRGSPPSQGAETKPGEPAESPVDEQPPGTRLVVRVVGPQLIICILPGNSATTRAMGCFAVVWLGFMAVFTFLMGKAPRGVHNGLIFLALFLLLFWSIGLATLYFFVRGRYGKTFVLIDPGRVSIKRELFGREHFKEYPLPGDGIAALELAFLQNNRPVYAVAIGGGARKAKFGTFLSQEEKEWLVDRINQHLDAVEKPA